MSPIAHPVHAAARADTTPSPVSTYPYLAALSTASMQQATGASSPTIIQVDSSVPPAVTSDNPSRLCKRGMTSRTKIGLGMIPVIVCLCAMWMFLLIWRRKRRARKAGQPPPVPQKDFRSHGGSIDSSRRVSKVFNMTAFSTPICDGRHREVSINSQSGGHDEARYVKQREKRQVDPATAMAQKDSPIDSKSPFHMKRDATVKRLSLGTEISNLWPSPPPSAWIKQSSDMEQVASRPSTRESSLSREFRIAPGRF